MKLIAIQGSLKGLVINLQDKDKWILGRDKDQCNFILEDASVSRKHAEIYKTKDGYVIKNLSSTNPIEVNEERVDEYLLEENDKVKIGNTDFLYTELSLEEVENEEEIIQDEYKEDLNSEDENFEEELENIEESFEKPKEKSLISDEDLDENLKENEKDKDLKKLEEDFEEPYDQTIFEEDEDEILTPLISDATFILKVVSGPNAGSEFGLEQSKTYIIGKDPITCDIIFTDISVSKQNTKITIDDNFNVFIEDLNSKNGSYVNNKPIKEKTLVSSKDLITLGTTTFLIVQRAEAEETIYAPAPSFEEEQPEEKTLEEAKKQKVEVKEKPSIWKKQFIPTRHLVIASSVVIIVFVVFISFFGLFKAKNIHVIKKIPELEIKKALKNFENVEFSYNPTSGNLFLVGHVITGIDKQELLYDIKQLDVVTKIEDNIIIDENVYKDFNENLNTQVDFRSVLLQAFKPGVFTLEGYVKTPDIYEKLTDYVNANFPYLDKLINKVVIEQILEVQIATKLQENNFNNVTFEIASGKLVLFGKYNSKDQTTFDHLLTNLKKTIGIRSVKNLAISTSAMSSRIDISKKYTVTGTAKYDDTNFSVLVNGKIITIGDLLDNMLVTQISENTILLEKDDIKYKINYSP